MFDIPMYPIGNRKSDHGFVGFMLRHHGNARYARAATHRTRDMQNKSFAGATKANEHRLRCKNLPPIQAREAARLVAGSTNAITACPTRYATLVEQRLQSARSEY
jgi:hypothetical protein